MLQRQFLQIDLILGTYRTSFVLYQFPLFVTCFAGCSLFFSLDHRPFSVSEGADAVAVAPELVLSAGDARAGVVDGVEHAVGKVVRLNEAEGPLDGIGFRAARRQADERRVFRDFEFLRAMPSGAAVSARCRWIFIGAKRRSRLARLESAKAIKAAARELARIVWAMLKAGRACVEKGIAVFEERRRKRKIASP